MGRKSSDSEASRWALLILLLIGLASCSLVYMCISVVFRPKIIPSVVDLDSEVLSSSMINEDLEGVSGSEEGECCKGIENLELWGAAVKWGSDFKFNTSEECCQACKAMCSGGDGPCLCDTWVFCGSRETCGPKFGECWLKKQRDTLAPDHHLSGEPQIWTSGLIFGKGEGIIGLETEYGVLHIKLFPDCAPHSVAYILELLGLHHCAGCQLYRAEGRRSSWDSEGNHISNAPLGPPFALLQGTLEAQGTTFKKIPTEACPAIRRGSVAWVGSGPEFFISLANHDEWKKAYTVFGSVLPEDMEIAEKIAQLPTKPDLWNDIEVSVLEKPIPLSFRRIKMSHGDLNLLNGS